MYDGNMEWGAAGSTVTLRGTGLGLEELSRIARGEARVELSADVQVAARVTSAYERMQAAAASGEIIYGVTTGFGGMADVIVSRAEQQALQMNMLWYHKTGLGRRLPAADVRAAMALRANSHLRGTSGVRLELVGRLATFLNAHVTPCVPELGSIGASGDLVPLTYITGALVGHAAGYRVDLGGREVDAVEALAALGLPRLELQPKEALAMLNGTSVMTGVAANCVSEARDLLAAALYAHALLIQALHGTRLSFHRFIHEQKPHPGQAWAAGEMRRLLDGSSLVRDGAEERHRNAKAGPVQDRYSLRCLPQYVGPVVDGIAQIGHQIEVEMNSTSDNPLIDPEDGAIYYGGNFLGQYVGVGMDQLRHHLGMLAKHLDVQIALLVAPEFSNGLPPSLVGNRDRRVNMGLKGLQLTANSVMPLLSYLGTPIVDRYPSHAEQFNQNVNSQGLNAANLARQSVDLLRQYIAIAFLFGVQGVDLRAHRVAGHYDARPLLSPATRDVYEAIRKLTSRPASTDHPWLWNDDDRSLDQDVETLAADLARHGALYRAIVRTELPHA